MIIRNRFIKQIHDVYDNVVHDTIML